MIRNICLILFLAVMTVSCISAQSREDTAKDDLDYYKGNDRSNNQNDNFGGSIWYGAGAQLGFQGGNGQSFFQIGISPIAGYKLNNFLSVGPRVSVAYNSFRFETFNGVNKNRYWTWSAGLFTRAKIYRGFFAHAEYSLKSEVDVFTNGDNERITRALPFLGGGISQGGGPGAAGFELLILFRLTQADRINDSPYEFRTGINYNF